VSRQRLTVLLWLVVTAGCIAAVVLTSSGWPVAVMIAGWWFCVLLGYGPRVLLQAVRPRMYWEPGNSNLAPEDFERDDE
jgi:hypothetical protein